MDTRLRADDSFVLNPATVETPDSTTIAGVRIDTLDFDATWRNAPAGKYTAIATLASENFPMEQRTEFIVH